MSIIFPFNCFLRLETCYFPGKTFPTYDPRTAEVIAHVAEGDAEDIDRAVSAARKAFDEGPWPKMTPYVSIASTFLQMLYTLIVGWCHFVSTLIYLCTCPGQERSLILLRFADLVEKHNDELAALETWNCGKPFEQSAKSEIPMLARLFRYYAGRIGGQINLSEAR